MIEDEVRSFIQNGYERAYKILTDHKDEWERLAQGLLEYETLTGDEIKRVMNGEPPQSGQDEGDDADQGSASITSVPKAKPKKSPPEGGMEPEPSA
jgi:cell division protease FtsH